MALAPYSRPIVDGVASDEDDRAALAAWIEGILAGYALASHSQAVSTISDSGATGRALVQAATAAAARTALGLGTAAVADTDDFATQAQGAKADAAAPQTALDAEASARGAADTAIGQRIDRIAISDETRPGENPEQFSADLTGEPEDRVPLSADGVVIDDDMGACWVRVGAGIVAPRRAYRIEEDRIYRLRVGFKRTVDSADLSGDSVQIKFRNLNKNKATVSTGTLQSYPNPVAADGIIRASFIISKDSEVDGVDYVPPATTRYGTPHLETIGNTPETGVAFFIWDDITDIVLGGADVASLASNLTTHTASTSNPHSVTKAQVGLGSVDNTSDADKPVSTAQAAADSAVGAVAAAALGAEIGDRKELIDKSEADDVVIRDASGRVHTRFAKSRLDVLGRVSIEPSGAPLRAPDATGFDAFGIYTDGPRYMGLPVGRYAAGYRRDTLHLAHWRQALARALLGGAAPRIVMLGDSNSMGWVSDGVGNSRRRQSHPYLLAKLLGGSNNDLFGSAIGSTATIAAYETYDDRVSIGTGWAAAGPESLGGSLWANATTTDALTMTPDAACDTVEMFIYSSSAAEANINYGGVDTPVSLPGGSVVRTEVTAASASLGAVNLTRVSGHVRLVGFSMQNSESAAPIVYGTGRSGLAAPALGAVANAYDAGSIWPTMNPDLVICEIGLNDRSADTDPDAYADYLRDIADLVPATADLMFVSSVSPARNETYLWQDYVAAMRQVADEYDAPLLDVSRIMGARQAVVAAGWHTDDLHPNKLGLAEKARQIKLILEM